MDRNRLQLMNPGYDVTTVLQELRGWTDKRMVGDGDERFCRFDEKPAAPAEVRDVAAMVGTPVPVEVQMFWASTRTAQLCLSVNIPFWGLELLSPTRVAEVTVEEQGHRPEQYRSGDFIAGEFIGDLEYLVITASETWGHGVLIALPMDPREEWYPVGNTLGEFLARYYEAEGEKFWEAANRDDSL